LQTRIKEMLNADCPVVIEAHTDPEIPSLPPYITLTQAKKLMKAIAVRDGP
jgi:pyruvate dehydrogenase (quinone)